MRILNRPVRLGRPTSIRGLPEAASGPAFAAATGMLAWAAGEGRSVHDIEPETNRGGLMRKFVEFLRERL
jgi:cell division protein FtsA